MPAYTIRIELRGSIAGQYSALDTEMDKAGFSNTIGGGHKKHRNLPVGQYDIGSSRTTFGVRSAAEAALKAAFPSAQPATDYAILVTPVAGNRSWDLD